MTTREVLLIVDVQNDFMPGGALAVPHGYEIIPVINNLQRAFSCILATKDWHPPNHVSFASTHGKKPGETIEVHGIQQELWPDHCIQGMEGGEFAPTLHTGKIKKVFFKGVDPLIDSYSAFYDNARIHTTGLSEYLEASGIDEIYLVGVATDYCIKYSALDGTKLGLKVHVVLDGCHGIDLKPGDIDRAIVEMEAAGAHMIDSAHCL